MKARPVPGLDKRATLADNIQRIVRVRARELRSFMPRALDPREVEALHDMRIAAKRLRYILELTAPCFGPYAAIAAGRAKDLQDVLGEIHDCDVTLPRVLTIIEEQRDAAAFELRRRAGDAPDLDPVLVAGLEGSEAWRGLEDLATYLRARRALLFERFVELWEQLQDEDMFGNLKAAIKERAAEPEPEPEPQPEPQPQPEPEPEPGADAQPQPEPEPVES